MLNRSFFEGGTDLRFIKTLLSMINWRQSWLLIPYFWFIIFLLAPLLIVLVISLSEPQLGSPPYTELFQWLSGRVLQIRLSFENYMLVLSKRLYCNAYLNSLSIAFFSTVVCLFLGYPIAYGITRASKRRRIVLMLLVILPFLTSFLVRMCAWINILSYKGLINYALSWLGVGPFQLIDTPFAVVIGMVYSYLPFMIFPLYASLEKIDSSLLEAAYDLGCKPWGAFWRIILPLSRSGIVAGASLVFIPAVGEYVIPDLLGGARCITVGRLLWYEFFINHDWPTACALALVMIAFLFIPIVVFEKIQTKLEKNLDRS